MKRVWIIGVTLVAVVALHTAIADPYHDLLEYKTGNSRAPLIAIETEIRDTKPSSYPALEDKLLAVLQSADATEDAKAFACRSLRQVGSAKCVPVVAPLLANEKLSHMARWALQGNPAPEAGKALRDALGSVKGNLLVGVIGTVGARRDADAVGTLASLAKDSDAAVAGAAMSALGQIGGAKAAEALEAAGASPLPTPSGTLQKDWAEASLACAESLTKANDASASKIYRKIFDGQFDAACRVAALAGLVRTGAIDGDALVAVLKGSDAKLQIEAAQLVGELRDAKAVQAYIAVLPSLTASVQVIVISGFATSANKAAASSVAALVESENAEVSAAALRALGVIGDASNVPVLMRLSLGKDERAALAFASLTRLPGAEVDAALEKRLRCPNPAERAKAIEVFTARMDRRQSRAILAACGDADRDVRMASCKALRSLADESMLPALADLLVAAITSDERNELEQTTSVVALRCASANAAAEVLAGKLGKSADADASLLTVLTKRSGTKALEAVRKCVAGTNLEQKKAAVRAMSSWADTTPLKDLMAVAKDDADTSCRVLALRGYVRLVSDSNEPVGWKMKMFEVALAAAKQPDSVKQVLSGLSNVKEVVALKMVMTQLDNTAVANEAAASALSISQELVNRKKAEDKIIVKAITKIKESASINEGLQKQAAELLKKLPQNVATKKP